MFFVVLAGISLSGEVNRVVTRLITRGVVVLRLLHSGLRSEAGSVCLAPPTTRVIQNLTEDREPTSPLAPIAAEWTSTSELRRRGGGGGKEVVLGKRGRNACVVALGTMRGPGS